MKTNLYLFIIRCNILIFVFIACALCCFVAIAQPADSVIITENNSEPGGHDLILPSIILSLGISISGGILALIYFIIRNKRLLNRMLVALYYIYTVHGKRISYIVEISPDESYGLFEIESINIILAKYYECNDSNIKRSRIIYDINNIIYLVGSHINSQDPMRYKRGVAFAKWYAKCLKEYLKNLLPIVPKWLFNFNIPIITNTEVEVLFEEYMKEYDKIKCEVENSER